MGLDARLLPRRDGPLNVWRTFREANFNAGLRAGKNNPKKETFCLTAVSGLSNLASFPFFPGSREGTDFECSGSSVGRARPW